jgi:hypothetical protein
MIEDLATSIGVAQPLLLHEVNFAPEFSFQFIRNIDEVEKAPSSPVLELHEDVDIARG